MKKIYLIDANSFIYRMFYGVPEMITKKGEYVNAIFGIARFFLVQMKYENPDYLIFVKDAKGKNFRHDLDENYKATRDKMPDNLKTQMPIISEMVKKMGVPIIEMDGFEADDVIGTLAHKYNGVENCEIDILTGDKDLYSLVSKNVCIYDTMKKKKFGIDETVEKFGVTPDLIIDYLAIVGDKADNIPGIAGFGPKKAVDLLNILGGISEIYKTLDEQNYDNLEEKLKKIYKGKNLEKLENSRENAFLSKKLATIELNVELPDFNLDEYKFTPEKYITPEIQVLFRELEFNSLLGEETPKLKKWDDLDFKVNIVDNDIKLENLFNNMKHYPQISLNIETTETNIIKSKIVGVSIFLNEQNVFYINRLHSGDKVTDLKLKDFFIKILKLDLTIIGYNLKFDLEIIDLFLKSEDIFYENIGNSQLGLGI